VIDVATFTALIHGEAGTGKSWFGDSTPAPRLILDAEGRARYLPSEPKVWWNPMVEAPPRYDGTWQTCIAIVPDYATMVQTFTWLSSGQHDFVSVVVDSLMEIQKRLIDAEFGFDQIKIQDWGFLLRHLEKLVRDYRDLVLVSTNPTNVVVFTVGSRDQDGKMRPILQGALRETVPYFVDTVGYLYTDLIPETGQLARSMQIQPTSTAVAKDNTNRLYAAYGPIIQNPNASTLYQYLATDAAVPAATVTDVPSISTEGVPQA
jgi:hypothetical protein